MATPWTPQKTEASEINGGNQFVDGQASTTSDFIKNVQNNLYAVEQAELAQSAASKAQTAATNAENAATNAATDTANQLASVVQAAQSAAMNSENSAQSSWQSAQDATLSASAAAISAQNSETSATNAETSASLANTRATNAETSATASYSLAQAAAQTVEDMSVIIQQLKLDGGYFDPSTGIGTITTTAQNQLGTTDLTITFTNDKSPITGYLASQGMYYASQENGTLFGIDFAPGDWLCATASGWYKEYQAGAVTGIKGQQESSYRYGQVNITAENILSPTQMGTVNKNISNIDNTSDANKPINTAMQIALNAKEPTIVKNTAFNKNFSTDNPQMDGVAFSGNSDTVARGNHVHATDTSRAADSAVAKLTGNQTIAGIKTFSTIPVLPSSNPTTDNQATRKAYVDNVSTFYVHYLKVLGGSNTQTPCIATVINRSATPFTLSTFANYLYSTLGKTTQANPFPAIGGRTTGVYTSMWATSSTSITLFSDEWSGSNYLPTATSVEDTVVKV